MARNPPRSIIESEPMPIAVSNIAWNESDDSEIFAMLRERGVTGIEIAPTKLWPGWEAAHPDAAIRYQDRLAAAGFDVPALQAILFDKPDCVVFDLDGARRLVDHMTLVADLAAAFGARSIVFGAPKNRLRQNRSMPEAMAAAVEVFHDIGEICAAQGVQLCIEPNPPQYGCDFITNSSQAAELIERADSTGLGLHLDAAAMHLAAEDGQSAITSTIDRLCHFHASEPNLGTFSEPEVDHEMLAGVLANAGYRNWISIEMRATEQPLRDVATAVDVVNAAYRSTLAAVS